LSGRERAVEPRLHEERLPCGVGDLRGGDARVRGHESGFFLQPDLLLLLLLLLLRV